MTIVRHQRLTILVLWLNAVCNAWVNLPTPAIARTAFQQRYNPVLYSTKADKEEKDQVAAESSSQNTSAVAEAPVVATKADEEDEDLDDDEYEFIEYEMLSESDYLGSEWMVGTLWDSNTNDIKETWVRLAIKNDKNIVVWGDGSEGTWSLDAASQFLGISKNYLWGKQIWAGVVDDYYFSQGTVRGWTYLTPASVLGQWQARRLGVDPDEAGVAPWFDSGDDEEEKEEAENEAEE